MNQHDKILAVVREMEGCDLLALLNALTRQVESDQAEENPATDGWCELANILDEERIRRRREILELERMYFRH